MNRRSFLKGLVAIAAAAAVGIPAIAQAEPDLDIWAEAIPDDVLDLPVTPENPFCWVDLDGVRYPLADAQLDIYQETQAMKLLGKWQKYELPTMLSWEIQCKSYKDNPEITTAMFGGKRMPCVLSLHRQRFGGDVCITEYGVNMDSWGEFACEFTLRGIGDLRTL